jgi:hypothetical protein
MNNRKQGVVKVKEEGERERGIIPLISPSSKGASIL